MDSSATLGRVLDPLRPHPHRGDLIAAAAVPLTVAVAMINVRFDSTWGHGIHFVITLLACALVLGMGLPAPFEEESPRAYQTVLLLAGLTLFAIVLLRLAQVFGEDEPLRASGTVTWMTTLFAALAAFAAWSRRSPICALLEFVAGGIALLAFVDWVFSPKGADTFRWLLLLLIVVYTVTHLRLREGWGRHSVHAVNAAGLAAIGLAGSFGAGLVPALTLGVRAPAGVGTGWAVVLLAVGFGLIAYAAVDREPGPGYLGFVVLLLFVALVGPPDSSGASLIGWPILLLLIGGAGLAAGLRPRRDLPPEPGPVQPPEPPAPLPAEPPTETLPPEPPTREHP